MKIGGFVLWCLLLLFAVPPAAHAHPSAPASRALSPGGYTVTNLGTPAGYTVGGDAFGINREGVVVGRACCGNPFTPPAYETSVAYRDGMIENLGGLSGYSCSNALGINDHGYTVGFSASTNGQIICDTFRAVAFLRSGAVVDLGSLPGDTNSLAYGVNDFGDAVGISFRPSTSTIHAVLFHRGAIVPLGLGYPYGVNDAGIAIGFDGSQATLFSRAGQKKIGALPGGTFSVGQAINDAGTGVGYSSTVIDGVQAQHGFVYAKGTMVDVGVPPGVDPASTQSAAIAIDATGDVVGWYEPANGARHALRSAGGSVVDLNSLIPVNSGWILNSASGINACGDIVGTGTYGGHYLPFLLRPTARSRRGAACQ